MLCLCFEAPHDTVVTFHQPERNRPETQRVERAGGKGRGGEGRGLRTQGKIGSGFSFPGSYNTTKTQKVKATKENNTIQHTGNAASRKQSLRVVARHHKVQQQGSRTRRRNNKPKVSHTQSGLKPSAPHGLSHNEQVLHMVTAWCHSASSPNSPGPLWRQMLVASWVSGVKTGVALIVHAEVRRR